MESYQAIAWTKEKGKEIYDTWFTGAIQHRVSTSLGMEIWAKRYRVLPGAVAPVVFIIVFVFSSFLLLSFRPSGVGHPHPLHAFVPAMVCLACKIMASRRVCLSDRLTRGFITGVEGKERKTSVEWWICDVRILFSFSFSLFSFLLAFFVPKVEVWSDEWMNETGACSQILYPKATAKKQSNQNRTYHIPRQAKCSRSSPNLSFR